MISDKVSSWFLVVFFVLFSQEFCGFFFGGVVDFIDYDD